MGTTWQCNPRVAPALQEQAGERCAGYGSQLRKWHCTVELCWCDLSVTSGGSTPGCLPKVASGHGAPEAAGARWERQGDSGHAVERDSKTGNGQWLQEVVVDGWGSEIQ